MKISFHNNVLHTHSKSSRTCKSGNQKKENPDPQDLVTEFVKEPPLAEKFRHNTRTPEQIKADLENKLRNRNRK